ncbi:hypothetical protein GEV33_001290 [Tenebrio molitor]|nr:hypothetical protein GEV33_001290 [Tenebrio molitor]
MSTFWNSCASSSNFGEIILQGPHQVAKKSITTS